MEGKSVATLKKDRKYIIYLVVVIGIFVTIKMILPRQYDWRVSLAHDDKNPFGAYALNELLPSLFEVKNSYQTLYELKDSLSAGSSLFILTATFNPGKEDMESLLRFVEKGGSAFISAEHFYGNFSDTLGISTRDYLFNENVLKGSDTATLHLANSHWDTTEVFSYRRDNIHNFFFKADSVTPRIMARNNKGKPVTLVIRREKGQLILNSTPLVFTNIHLLPQNNSKFVSAMLSYLPSKQLWWTEFYHLGRMEAGTPLRFILTTEPLRWAYYISILSILAFMLFEVKRKQRVIPIITPLANTTLEFIFTVGNLYFQRRDHKNLAEKKILFFFDKVRTRFYLNTTRQDVQFIHALARKSGNTEEDVKSLLASIKEVQGKQEISSEELIGLSKKMGAFWKQTQ